MSGALVPYHQRQNKAVDRHVFIDLLGRLAHRLPIADYAYVSFGGAFLEDFKLIHAAFGNKHLISLEMDEVAWARQQFNLPLSCIKPIKTTAGEYIQGYALNKNAIVWLDYAAAMQTRVQLEEFQALLKKLRTFDIVKITLNANPNSLRPSTSTDNQGNRETTEVRNTKRLDILTKRIGDLMPNGVTADQMTDEGYGAVLAKAVEMAANGAMNSKPAELFQPLTIFSYNDLAHQMLTVTGVIIPKKGRRQFFKDARLIGFKLTDLDWGKPRKIMLPALTARERLFIDRHLPKRNARAIQRRLKFHFDKNVDRSLEILANYIQYYRQYPNFHRVLF